MTDYRSPAGFDRTRNVEIGVKDIKVWLKKIEIIFLIPILAQIHWRSIYLRALAC